MTWVNVKVYFDLVMRYIQIYSVNLVVRVDFQLDSASVPNSRGTRSRHGKALTGTHELEKIFNGFLKTSQELRMLSSVTINCQVTKIVMNSGSQL